MRKVRILSSVFISIIVLFVILTVVAFLILRNNPAFVLELILRKNTSQWTVGFDSIEYDDGSKYVVSGFRLYHGEEVLMTISKAEVNLNLGELIEFIKEKGSSVSISAQDCVIDITGIVEAYNEKDEESKKNGFSLYSFIIERSFDCSAENVEISSDEVKGKITDVSLSYESSSNVLNAFFILENASFNYPDYCGLCTGGSITLALDDEIWIEGEVSEVDLETSGIREQLSSVTLSGRTDSVSDFFEAEFIGDTVIEIGSITYEDFNFEFNNGAFAYSDKAVKGTTASLSALYDGFSLELDKADFSLSYTGEFHVSSSLATVAWVNQSFYVESPSMEGSLIDFSLLFTSPLISEDLSELTNNILGKGNLYDVNVDCSSLLSLSLSGSFDCSIETISERLDDITFTSVFSSSLNENGETLFKLDMENLLPGFDVSSPLSISIAGNTEEASINADSDNFFLDSTLSIVNRSIQGELDISSLPLKSVIEVLLNKEIVYLTDNTLVSLSFDYSLLWKNEDEVLTGNAYWECSFDYSYLSFFKVLFSSSSALFINGDTIDIQDLVISTPFFTLEGDGYYDLKEGKPHIEFR